MHHSIKRNISNHQYAHDLFLSQKNRKNHEKTKLPNIDQMKKSHFICFHEYKQTHKLRLFSQNKQKCMSTVWCDD